MTGKAYLFLNKKRTVAQPRHAFPIVVFAVGREDAISAAYHHHQRGYTIQGEIDPATFNNHGLSITTEALSQVLKRNLEELLQEHA